MGARSIREWQKKAGIKPASGKELEKLNRLSKHAYDLIRIIELERSGIRDGAGYWCGGDMFEYAVMDIVDLGLELCGRKKQLVPLNAEDDGM
jgi:hypothetical protein